MFPLVVTLGAVIGGIILTVVAILLMMVWRRANFTKGGSGGGGEKPTYPSSVVTAASSSSSSSKATTSAATTSSSNSKTTSGSGATTTASSSNGTSFRHPGSLAATEGDSTCTELRVGRGASARQTAVAFAQDGVGERWVGEAAGEEENEEDEVDAVETDRMMSTPKSNRMFKRYDNYALVTFQ